MADLATIDLIGFWLGIFLTFCILSFLYKDNPFYKVAEHLFIGVSIGYIVTRQYYDTLKPKLVVSLADGKWWYLLGLALAVMLLLKLFRRTSHLGRYPIAFVVGFFAGLQIIGVAQGDLGRQAEKAMESVEVRQLDLNTATPDEMSLLPGFNPIVTKLVIERRKEKPFTSLDELYALEGLTAMQVEDLKAARGFISGLDSRAATLEMISAKDRLAQMSARLKGHIESVSFRLLDDANVVLEGQVGSASAARKNLADSKSELGRVEASRVSSHAELSAMEDVVAGLVGAPAPSRAGGVYAFGTLSKILLLLGLLAGLIYFYFSIEQKGNIGRVSRFGIWVLMVGFGASFGYTVQGRISLAIGRVLDIGGADKDPNLAAQIHGVAVAGASIAIIIIGLVLWELRQRRQPPPSQTDDDEPEPSPGKGGGEEEE